MIDFLDALRDVKVRAALLADISILADEGPILPFPLTSAVQSHKGLRELRTRHGGTQIRTLYAVVNGDAVVLNAFRKTSATQVRREYSLAADRLRSYR